MPTCAHAIENIVDGAYFNSGQSCCGMQRIYVHESVYERFHARLHRADPASTGSAIPLDPADHPRTAGAHRRRRRGARAGAAPRWHAGARPLIDEREFAAQPRRHAVPRAAAAARCAGHSVVMREEIFGPVVGIMKVRSDDEAVAH